MTIDFHKSFDKQFHKLPPNHQSQFRKRLALYANNHNHPSLHNHALKGSYLGYRSINVSGDMRAIFTEHDAQHVEFVAIGSHSQLYN